MNKHLLPVICFAISVLVFSCSNRQKVAELVSKHFEMLNSHDIDQIATDYAADAKISSTSFDDVRTGPTQVKIIFNRYFSSSPDLHYKITGTMYTDTSAVIQYESTGSIPADDFTSPEYMRGKKYTLRNCVVLGIKNDKIISEATYFDQNSFMHQIGYFDQPCDKRN